METKKVNKESKTKPLYSTWQNVKYTVSNIWKWDKPLVFLSLSKAPLNVILTLSGMIIVRLVMSLIENKADGYTFIYQILLFSGVLLLVNALCNLVGAKIEWRQFSIRFKYLNNLAYKQMDADYENVENPECLDKLNKATNAVENNNGATQNIINILVNLGSSLIGITTLSVIISTLNPFLLLFITATLVAQYLVNRACQEWHYRNRDNWVKCDRKLDYMRNMSGDFNRAKDIRIYNLKEWFKDIFLGALHDREKWFKKTEKASYYYYDIAQVVQMLLTMGATYGYVIYAVTNNSLSVADAVFYISAVGTFSGVIMSVFNSISDLTGASLSICNLREYLDIPDKSNRGKGAAIPTTTVDIEFTNVSYMYSKTQKNTIDNLSFKINKGEKIAIVGMNGAGKTTLVKLISGLYRPTVGDIKISGVNISEYNRDEYFSLMSTVFQDIYLYPTSIAQNISFEEKENLKEDLLNNVIELAGLKEKIASLPDRYNTPLVKSVFDEAIELSGGEKQKLALARALYKEALFLILDEPTAALDPIAENEMYLKYNELSKGKTSIFISHRLSSTRFCDRIFFIEDGKIVESGTHDYLMKQNGKYAEMFNVQSHYYKEGAVNEKA